MRKTKLERVAEAITITEDTPTEWVECAYCKCHVKDETILKATADGKPDIYGCHECYSNESYFVLWVNDNIYNII